MSHCERANNFASHCKWLPPLPKKKLYMRFMRAVLSFVSLLFGAKRTANNNNKQQQQQQQKCNCSNSRNEKYFWPALKAAASP